MNEISIKKAAMINFISKYANVIIQILITSILARILTPEDFGIVAIISVFTTFFIMFADMGIGAAIIQNKTLANKDIENIFSFTIYLAVILSAVFALFSIPLSSIYKNKVYIPIGIILSFSLFFNTLNVVPNAMLLKNKKFATIGIRTIIISTMSGILTIILALYEFKYYAIVLSSVITALLTFFWNFIDAPLKPTMKFDKSSIIKIKDFSIFQFAFNIVNYFSRNLDNLLIGKFMGSAALGYYDKGYRMMLYPISILTGVITPVLHPILSDHQDNKEYIFFQYLKVVKILSLIGLFVTVYCFFSAKEIIVIMFGERWMNTIVPFKILALSVWPQIITSSTGAIFQSLGYTRLLFRTGMCNSLITITVISIGVLFQDITIVAFCVTISYIIHFLVAYFILVKFGFKKSYLKFLKNMWVDVTIAIITCTGLYLASFLKVDNVVLSAIYKGVTGGLAYILGLLVTKQYKIFFLLIRKN
ncbi:lipopolysaccharide biosynthesis protein [Priestia megaterium]|uniref:lipopolysaccharide biosynthesis protein n=1 Tax=Priestia megaterium TaxID=1404 RepID=UPI00367154C3